jgi:chemotaxis protein methyltransferase CheR
VAIYFDARTQDRIWHGFSLEIEPGGYMFIGHSERLSLSMKQFFDIAGMTAFRRTNKFTPLKTPKNH